MDEHHRWSQEVASHYSEQELSAMTAWLDTNIQLNQVRLESLTSRLLALLGVVGVLVSVLVAASSSKAVPITALSGVCLSAVAVITSTGLVTSLHDDNDPSSTWETLWGQRAEGEVLAVLLSRRGFLYEDQRKLIFKRASALKLGSFVTVGSGLLVLAAVIVSGT